jgi:Ca2+/Na+ antiporter
MEKIKEFIAAGVIVASGIIYLLHGIAIKLYDQVYIYENNDFIINSEIVLFVAIILFGLERFHYGIRT